MSKKKPLYSAIVDDLQKRIAEGEYQPGENLPTESELCEQYNVSRITVRKAISCLEEEGVIDHPFSKTPCVKKSSIPRRINYMRGLSEDLMREGVRCSNYILKAEKMSADETLAEAMEIAVGEPLYYVERLRYGNGEPLCYQSLYLVARFCPGILDEDLAKESIYALLENKYGMKIDHCVQNITACISSYRICWNYPTAQPCLRSQIRDICRPASAMNMPKTTMSAKHMRSLWNCPASKILLP